jgi:nucleoside-diphosphate kinase
VFYMKNDRSKRSRRSQYVLVVIKPDGMNKAFAGLILQKFFATKLELVAAKALLVSRELAEEHYQHIKGQPFYEQTIDVMLGRFYKQKRVLALVFSGPEAIRKCRTVAGATNPKEADPRSVRGAFGRVTPSGIYENVVHVSSDPREAEREIKLWFLPEQMDTQIFPTKKTTNGRRQKMVWA